jgi:sulfide dehydrogenase cytochrome subunit
MNKSWWTAALLIGFATCVQPQPAGPAALHASSLAATCAACHGTDGRVVGTAGAPALAGKRREEFIAQMRDFKSGARPSTVMGQLSKGFDEAQIELLAQYFSALKEQ